MEKTPNIKQEKNKIKIKIIIHVARQ